MPLTCVVVHLEKVRGIANKGLVILDGRKCTPLKTGEAFNYGDGLHVRFGTESNETVWLTQQCNQVEVFAVDFKRKMLVKAIVWDGGPETDTESSAKVTSDTISGMIAKISTAEVNTAYACGKIQGSIQIFQAIGSTELSDRAKALGDSINCTVLAETIEKDLKK